MDTRAKERSLPWPAQQITTMKSQSGGGYLRLRSRRPLFYASFIFYWHDWRYRFFCRWRLLSWRRWLLAQCLPCNFPARFALFLFRLPLRLSLLYASRDRDRHYRLDHFRASRARHWLEQIREMESARQIGARPSSDGPGTPGKNAQSNEP